MSNENNQKQPSPPEPGGELQQAQEYQKEGNSGLYGWSFHRAPLIAALILTLLFYLFVFFWVD